MDDYEPLKTDPSLAGGLAENFVIMEVVKQSETKPKIFFWRTASGREVDIVLEDNAGRIVGLEVKSAQRQIQTTQWGYESCLQIPGDSEF
jgi:predicted AAA+ superfamily ATPase